jgi:hypothetical protein
MAKCLHIGTRPAKTSRTGKKATTDAGEKVQDGKEGHDGRDDRARTLGHAQQGQWFPCRSSRRRPRRGTAHTSRAPPFDKGEPPRRRRWPPDTGVPAPSGSSIIRPAPPAATKQHQARTWERQIMVTILGMIIIAATGTRAVRRAKARKWEDV